MEGEIINHWVLEEGIFDWSWPFLCRGLQASLAQFLESTSIGKLSMFWNMHFSPKYTGINISENSKNWAKMSIFAYWQVLRLVRQIE